MDKAEYNWGSLISQKRNIYNVPELGIVEVDVLLYSLGIYLLVESTFTTLYNV